MTPEEIQESEERKQHFDHIRDEQLLKNKQELKRQKRIASLADAPDPLASRFTNQGANK